MDYLIKNVLFILIENILFAMTHYFYVKVHLEKYHLQGWQFYSQTQT